MLKLGCDIQIGNYAFDYVTDCRITQRPRALSTVCRLELPRRLKYRATPVRELFKRGDRITVKLGYDGKLDTVFTGYLTRIGADVPVEIEAEDEMFQLKNMPVQAQTFAAGTTVRKLLEAVTGGRIKFETGFRQLGKIALAETTVFAVLKGLQKNYQIDSFFDGGTLYVGTQPSPTERAYHLQENVVGNRLEYLVEADVKIRVKATGIDAANERTVVEVGDEGGDLRTLHFMNLSEAELKRQAEAHLKLFKYESYRGSLTGFGLPATRRGDTVEIRDDHYPDRRGRYRVGRVDLRFGLQGYRRTVHLENRLT